MPVWVGVVTSLLNQYLGSFLEGLDAEQLKISVWGGEVNLVDVKVKKNALDFLHLPLSVQSGHVEKLHIAANWRHLSSRPVSVVLSGVYLVAAPSERATVDEKAELQAALQAKVARLQAVEELLFGNDDEGGEDGYVGRLATKIIDNIQVTIEDVHICYEDFSPPQRQTSFGIALKRLKAETTDDKWKPVFLQESGKKGYKLVSLTQLCMYVDPKDPVALKPPTDNESDAAQSSASEVDSKKAKNRTLSSSSSKALTRSPSVVFDEKLRVDAVLNNPDTCFLLRPVSGRMRLCFNKEVHPAPRLWVDSQLYGIELQLMHAQYAAMLEMVERVAAAQSSMAQLLDSFKERFRPGTVTERREYTQLYKRTLNALWLPALSESDLRRKEELERELRYDDIAWYRTTAIAELKRELGIVDVQETSIDDKGMTPAQVKAEQERLAKLKKQDRARASVMLRADAEKLTATFLSRFHIGRPKAIKPERELTDAEREAIFARVQSESILTQEELPKDYIHLKLAFALDVLSLAIGDERNPQITQLKAQNSVAELIMRDKSMATSLHIGDVSMADNATPGTLFPLILHHAGKEAGPTTRSALPSAPSSSSSSSGPVLSLEVHSPPLDERSDLRIALRLRAATIVLQRPFMEAIISFFKPPRQLDWSVLSVYSAESLNTLQAFSSVQLSDALQSHMSMDVSLDIAAPTIIIPRDPTQSHVDALVLDLGTLQVGSRVQPRQVLEQLASKLKTMSSEQIMQMDEYEKEKCYDVYNVNVRHVSVYLTSVSSVLQGTSASLRHHLLQPFDASVSFWQCMSSEVISLPDIRLIADMPAINLAIANHAYTRLINVVTAFDTILQLFMPPAITEKQLQAQQKARAAQAGAGRALNDARNRLIGSLAGVDREAKKRAAAQLPATDEDEQLDLAALSRMTATLADAEELMRQVDTDGSGTISRAELQSWAEERQKARQFNETLDLQVQLGAIAFTLSEDLHADNTRPPQHTPIMQFKLDHIQVSMRQQSWTMKLGLLIGGLSIQDMASTNARTRCLLRTFRHATTGVAGRTAAPTPSPSSSPAPMLQTHSLSRPVVQSSTSALYFSGDEFVNVQMVTTSDRSPSFAQHPVDVDLRVGFSAVSMCVEPQTIHRITVYAFDTFLYNQEANEALAALMQGPVEEDAKPSGESAESDSGEAEAEAESKLLTPSSSSQEVGHGRSSSVASTSKQARDVRVSVNISAYFESFEMCIYYRDSPLTEARMTSLRADLQLFPTASMRVAAQLQDLHVKDLTPAGAQYPMVISMRKQQQQQQQPSSSKEKKKEPTLVTFVYNTFSVEEADYPGFNSSVEAVMQGLQFTFLYRFTLEMMFLFTTGPIADLMDYMSEASAHAAQVSAVQTAVADAMAGTVSAAQMSRDLASSEYMHMDVTLHGIDVIVPAHSQSDETMRADMQQLRVTSAMRQDRQEILIDASALKAGTFILAHSESPVPLLELTPFRVVITLLPASSLITVGSDVDALTMVLTPIQFNWLLSLVGRNLSEPATVVKPLKQSRGTAADVQQAAATRPSVTSRPDLAKAVEATSKSTNTPADKQQLVLQLSANLRNLSLRLNEGAGMTESGQASEAGDLVLFEMSDLSGKIDMFADGGLDLNGSCAKLALRDVSESGAMFNGGHVLPAYREILQLVHDNRASKQSEAAADTTAQEQPLSLHLHMSVDESGASWIVTSVSLAHFRFHLAPILLRLPAFFASLPATADDEEQERMQEAMMVQRAQIAGSKRKPVQTTKYVPPSYIVLKLSLASPILQVVQDPTSSVSDAMLMSFGLTSDVLMSVIDGETVISAAARVMAFKSFSTRLDVNQLGQVQVSYDPAITTIIMQPCDIKTTIGLTFPRHTITADELLEKDVDITKPLPLPTLRAHIATQPVRLRLSYRTYRLALRTMDALVAATSETESDVKVQIPQASAISSSSTRPSSSTATRAKSPTSSRSMRISADSESASRPVGQEKGDTSNEERESPLFADLYAAEEEDVDSKSGASAVEVALFNAEEITMEVEEVHVSVLNDAAGLTIPIARLHLSPLNVHIHGYAHQRAIRANMKMNIDYYNQGLVAWEPVLEPWQCEARIIQSYILSTAAFNMSLQQHSGKGGMDSGRTTRSPSVEDVADPSSIASDLPSSMDDDSYLSRYSGNLLTHSLSISSSTPLNLNLSHAMYSGVNEALCIFTEVEQRHKHALASGMNEDAMVGLDFSRASLHVLRDGNRGEMKQGGMKPHDGAVDNRTLAAVESNEYDMPYRFDNFTELSCQLNLVRQHNRGMAAKQAEAQPPPSAEGTVPLTVDAYTSLRFAFPASIPATEHGLSMRLHASGYGTLGFSVPLNANSTHSFLLPLTIDGSRNARVIFEVRTHAGTKVIRLRGVIGIKNKTGCALEMRAMGAGLSDSNVAPSSLRFPVLQPGDEYFMPLMPTHESGGFLVTVRPRAQAGTPSAFSWSSPLILMPEYSEQNQFIGCTSTNADAGSTSSTVDEHAPVIGKNGEFNCSVSIHHIWSTELQDSTSTLPASKRGGESAAADRSLTGQVYVVGASMTIENLTAEACEIKLIEKDVDDNIIVHWSNLMSRGDRQPLHIQFHRLPAYMQLRMPALECVWSGLLALPQLPPEGSFSATYPLVVRDESSREIVLHVEVSIKTTTTIVIYAPFWVYDLTGLGLILSCDRKQTVPLGSVDAFRQRLQTDARPPLMYNFPLGHHSEKKSVCLTTLSSVEHARSWTDVQWSSPITVDKPGLSVTTTILGEKQARLRPNEQPIRPLHDIGVSVTTASGRFRRTKCIYLTPHFLVINHLSCDVEFMQRVSGNPQLVHQRSGPAPTFTLPAASMREFHWPDSVANRTLCLRRAGASYKDWRWSGDLDPTAVSDTPIMVRHKSEPNKCWYARVQIHQQDATIVIQISEYKRNEIKTIMPYRVYNQCVHQTMRVRQYIPPPGHKSCILPVPPCDWLSVPSYSGVPVCAEVPLYAHPLMLEVQLGLTYAPDGSVRAEHTCVVSMDEIKGCHAKLQLPPAAHDELELHQTVYLYSAQDANGAIILHASNYPSADALEAELKAKLKSKLQPHYLVARQREKRWKELIDMQTQLERRIQLLQRRRALESTRLLSASQSSSSVVRPASLAPRDSALLIELRAARGLPFSTAYFKLHLQNQSAKSETKKAGSRPAIAFNQRFMFITTHVPSSAKLRVGVWEDGGLFSSDEERGSIELSILDMSYEAQTRRLKLQGRRGESVGEVELILCHIPQSGGRLDEHLRTLDSLLTDHSRILRAVQAEMSRMQQRGMVDEKGRIMPVRLQNDVRFRMRLKNMQGMVQAVKKMQTKGDVVCRVRSQLTGKTVSVMCFHHDPNQPNQLIDNSSQKGLASARPSISEAASSSSSSSSRSPAPSSSSAPSTQDTLVLSWSQDIVMNVPEQMVNRENETLHLSFFFQQVDEQGEADAEAAEQGRAEKTVTTTADEPSSINLSSSSSSTSPTHASSHAAVKDAALLHAAKLRGAAPPSLLGTIVLPLRDAPLAGSEQPPVKASKGAPPPINWSAHRLPVKLDPSVGASSASVFVTVSVEREQARSERNRIQTSVDCDLPLLSFSLIDGTPRELLFFSITGLHALINDTLSSQEMEARIDRIQLDNQDPRAVFPVIIGFSPVEEEKRQPMLQMAIAKRKTDARAKMQIFEYASVLLQKLDVKVEEEVIYTILSFINSFDTAATDDERVMDESWVIQSVSASRHISEANSELLLFFHLLYLQPMAFNIWFEAKPGLRAHMADMVYNPMQLLLSMVGTTMASVHNAPIRLNGRMFEHVRGSVSVIVWSLAQKYKNEILTQAYKLLGSLEFLGNPVGLVSNMGSGLADFFTEPVNGAVHSPQQFGVGLAKGSLSLVKGTVGGVLTSVGSITGTFAKGFAVASLDSDFIESSTARQHNAPKNAVEGLVQGTKSLAGGIFKGITGIITDPIRGAREGGAAGFAKGVGKGLLGVVAKPVSGSIGFASQTLTGLGNTPDFISDNKVHPKRVRPMRPTAPDLPLTPFEPAAAMRFEKEQMARVKKEKKEKDSLLAGFKTRPSTSSDQRK